MKIFDKQDRETVVPYDAALLSITVEGVVIFNPLRTPDNSAFCTPERYGFGIWETGGGCLAWGMELPDGGHFLITDENGSRLPEEDDEYSPYLCRYDNEGGQVAAVDEFEELPKNGSAQHGA